MNNRTQAKTAYVCSVAWDHEVGQTEVALHASAKGCKHIGCGVEKVKLTHVRTVKRENLDAPGACIPIGRAHHEQMKSVRAQIRWLQGFLKRLETEDRTPWRKTNRK